MGWRVARESWRRVGFAQGFRRRRSPIRQGTSRTARSRHRKTRIDGRRQGLGVQNRRSGSARSQLGTALLAGAEVLSMADDELRRGSRRDGDDHRESRRQRTARWIHRAQGKAVSQYCESRRSDRLRRRATTTRQDQGDVSDSGRRSANSHYRQSAVDDSVAQSSRRYSHSNSRGHDRVELGRQDWLWLVGVSRPLRRIVSRLSSALQGAQTFRVRRIGDASLGNNCGYQLGWRYIERGVECANPLRRDLLATVLGKLAAGALFDWNRGAVGTVQVDRRERRGDVERYAVAPRHHGERI